MAPQSPVKDTAHTPDVDYVISFSPKESPNAKVQAELERLLKALTKVGLAVAVRNGENKSLLIFVRPADAGRFGNEIHKYRVKDWLHGIRMAQPDKNEPSMTAERLRTVRHLIANPPKEGGASITAQSKDWEHVDAIFPLHDPDFNRAWIKKWSQTTFLKREDLDEIRNMFGEKVAYYFAFTQFYFASLMFPALFGFSAWVLLGQFSPVFAVFNVLWCVGFVEYWKQQEVDLALRWGVKNVTTILEKRHDFQADSERTDEVTGETVHVFPAHKRLLRQALQAPFALLAIVVLGTLIASCFAIEVFLSEVYSGPFKDVLVFVPTALLTVFIPILSTFLGGIATRLTKYENYETTEAYNAAITSKLFVLNFITSYLGIFLTAFVYVPFGNIIVPYLDIFRMVAPISHDVDKSMDQNLHAFTINPDRLRKQVIYFTVTAQVVNFALETVVPYVKQRATKRYQDYQTSRATSKGNAPLPPGLNDHADEAAFLERARHEAALEPYEVTDDLREMVVQFGYLALFAVVWPLVPCSFVFNNWIELRSDAVKICLEKRRPDPLRRDGVGPWLESLEFLAWLGSVTTAALVYMFHGSDGGPGGEPGSIRGWALLLAIACSEHLYLLVRWGVRVVISRMETPGMRKERAERYMFRKRYFDEHFGGEAAKDADADAELAAAVDSAGDEKITRQSLEDDLRAGTLKTSTDSDHFWARQKGWQESFKVGVGLINHMTTNEEGKKDR